MLTKNKMELAKTINNSTILHRGIGNCNALWNKLLTKQTSSLHSRLNASGPEETLMLLRIIHGLRLIGQQKTLGMMRYQKPVYDFGKTT